MAFGNLERGGMAGFRSAQTLFRGLAGVFIVVASAANPPKFTAFSQPILNEKEKKVQKTLDKVYIPC